eukprot:GILJ01016156.1.p2 GENE.GILJ01016156.1~~GILJ01016156.1.p2  ORF type:complete len:109 (-),score=3.72 GILJ01016156.1:249-575(-)
MYSLNQLRHVHMVISVAQQQVVIQTYWKLKGKYTILTTDLSPYKCQTALDIQQQTDRRRQPIEVERSLRPNGRLHICLPRIQGLLLIVRCTVSTTLSLPSVKMTVFAS